MTTPLRMLRMMAGIIKTPYEKQVDRQKRKLARLERDWKIQLATVHMIQARERGEDGYKPMPFAKPENQGTTDG